MAPYLSYDRKCTVTYGAFENPAPGMPLYLFFTWKFSSSEDFERQAIQLVISLYCSEESSFQVIWEEKLG